MQTRSSEGAWFIKGLNGSHVSKAAPRRILSRLKAGTHTCVPHQISSSHNGQEEEAAPSVHQEIDGQTKYHSAFKRKKF